MCRIAFAVVMLMAASASAETFDAATFTPPTGWQRHVLPGAVAYGFVDNVQGGYALVTVFASVGTCGDPARDFAAAWHDLVAVPSRVVAPTQGPALSTTKQGLPMIMGGAQTVLDGVTSATLVAVIVSRDRVVRVVAASNAPRLVGAFDAMLAGMVVGAPSGPAQTASPDPQPPAAPGGDLDDYQIAVPAGWTARRERGALVMTSPTGECTLAAMPERPAQGSLDNEANAAFTQAFAGWQHRNSSGPYERVASGVSVDGWEYIRLDSFLNRPAGGRDQFAKTEILGVVFAVRLDDVTAVFVGSRANTSMTSATTDVLTLTPRCLDDFTPSEWGAFVRDLHFKRWKPKANVLKDKLVGTWQSSYGGSVIRYELDANGHYTAIAGYQTERRVGVSMIETTMHAFPGKGRYELAGDTLTLIPDGRPREIKKVRWYMKFELGHWRPTLRLQDKTGAGEMLLLNP